MPFGKGGFGGDLLGGGRNPVKEEMKNAVTKAQYRIGRITDDELLLLIEIVKSIEDSFAVNSDNSAISQYVREAREQLEALVGHEQNEASRIAAVQRIIRNLSNKLLTDDDTLTLKDKELIGMLSAMLEKFATQLQNGAHIDFAEATTTIQSLLMLKDNRGNIREFYSRFKDVMLSNLYRIEENHYAYSHILESIASYSSKIEGNEFYRLGEDVSKIPEIKLFNDAAAKASWLRNAAFNTDANTGQRYVVFDDKDGEIHIKMNEVYARRLAEYMVTELGLDPSIQNINAISNSILEAAKNNPKMESVLLTLVSMPHRDAATVLLKYFNKELQYGADKAMIPSSVAETVKNAFQKYQEEHHTYTYSSRTLATLYVLPSSLNKPEVVVLAPDEEPPEGARKIGEIKEMAGRAVLHLHNISDDAAYQQRLNRIAIEKAIQDFYWPLNMADSDYKLPYFHVVVDDENNQYFSEDIMEDILAFDVSENISFGFVQGVRAEAAREFLAEMGRLDKNANELKVKAIDTHACSIAAATLANYADENASYSTLATDMMDMDVKPIQLEKMLPKPIAREVLSHIENTLLKDEDTARLLLDGADESLPPFIADSIKQYASEKIEELEKKMKDDKLTKRDERMYENYINLLRYSDTFGVYVTTAFIALKETDQELAKLQVEYKNAVNAEGKNNKITKAIENKMHERERELMNKVMRFIFDAASNNYDLEKLKNIDPEYALLARLFGDQKLIGKIIKAGAVKYSSPIAPGVKNAIKEWDEILSARLKTQIINNANSKKVREDLKQIEASKGSHTSAISRTAGGARATNEPSTIFVHKYAKFFTGRDESAMKQYLDLLQGTAKLLEEASDGSVSRREAMTAFKALHDIMLIKQIKERTFSLTTDTELPPSSMIIVSTMLDIDSFKKLVDYKNLMSNYKDEKDLPSVINLIKKGVELSIIRAYSDFPMNPKDIEKYKEEVEELKEITNELMFILDTINDSTSGSKYERLHELLDRLEKVEKRLEEENVRTFRKEWSESSEIAYGAAITTLPSLKEPWSEMSPPELLENLRRITNYFSLQEDFIENEDVDIEILFDSVLPQREVDPDAVQTVLAAIDETNIHPRSEMKIKDIDDLLIDPAEMVVEKYMKTGIKTIIDKKEEQKQEEKIEIDERTGYVKENKNITNAISRKEINEMIFYDNPVTNVMFVSDEHVKEKYGDLRLFPENQKIDKRYFQEITTLAKFLRVLGVVDNADEALQYATDMVQKGVHFADINELEEAIAVITDPNASPEEKDKAATKLIGYAKQLDDKLMGRADLKHIHDKINLTPYRTRENIASITDKVLDDAANAAVVDSLNINEDIEYTRALALINRRGATVNDTFAKIFGSPDTNFYADIKTIIASNDLSHEEKIQEIKRIARQHKSGKSLMMFTGLAATGVTALNFGMKRFDQEPYTMIVMTFAALAIFALAALRYLYSRHAHNKAATEIIRAMKLDQKHSMKKVMTRNKMQKKIKNDKKKKRHLMSAPSPIVPLEEKIKQMADKYKKEQNSAKRVEIFKHMMELYALEYGKDLNDKEQLSEVFKKVRQLGNIDTMPPEDIAAIFNAKKRTETVPYADHSDQIHSYDGEVEHVKSDLATEAEEMKQQKEASATQQKESSAIQQTTENQEEINIEALRETVNNLIDKGNSDVSELAIETWDYIENGHDEIPDEHKEKIKQIISFLKQMEQKDLYTEEDLNTAKDFRQQLSEIRGNGASIS